MPNRADQPLLSSFLDMPRVEQGMTVGLFGGSFNPPHEGHVLVARTAIERLQLDQLWWMVSPGNPLKDHAELAPLPQRIALSTALLQDDPRIVVTAFEEALKIRYSAETIEHVCGANPGVCFVWIMGADSLLGFHEWERWRFIVETIPIAVFERPGAVRAEASSVMARTFASARVDESKASALARMQPPAWTFISGTRSPLSSTELRKAAGRTDEN